MKRIILMIVFSTLLIFSGCSMEDLPSTVTYGSCKDYANQKQAQRAWTQAGKPSGEDRNGDGKVCDSLASSGEKFTPTGACPKNKQGIAVVRLSRREYPNIVDHIQDSIKRGYPRVLTRGEPGVDNRDVALAGIPTEASRDREEFPPNSSREGGTSSSSVRMVDDAENQGAGSVLGHQIANCKPGTKFFFRFSGSFPDGFDPSANTGQVRPQY